MSPNAVAVPGAIFAPVLVMLPVTVPIPVKEPPFRTHPQSSEPPPSNVFPAVWVRPPERLSMPLLICTEPELLMGTCQVVVPVGPLCANVPVLLNTTTPLSANAVSLLVTVQLPELLITPGFRTYTP